MFKKFFELGILVRALLVKTAFNQNSLFFTQISTNVRPLLRYVTSMLSARILVGLIAANAKLVFLETAKLAKVCDGLSRREA